jgi:hypothetical protein
MTRTGEAPQKARCLAGLNCSHFLPFLSSQYHWTEACSKEAKSGKTLHDTRKDMAWHDGSLSLSVNPYHAGEQDYPA